MLKVRKAAVIGAGTMGAQIAAHLANVGIPCVLLDLAALPSTLSADRNQNTRTLWERVIHLTPPPLFLPQFAERVRLGNIEDDLKLIADADWIIEAIVERLEPKLELYAKIAELARPGALITTNTSGLPIQKLSQGLPEIRRSHFFGTHFFNPPRYMRLMEVIASDKTDRQLLANFAEFSEDILGKSAVHAKDSPGFISNRIGYFAMQHAARLGFDEDLSIEDVDAITGSALGRPRSATFRLHDLVGLDVMAHIGRDLSASLTADEEKRFFRPLAVVEELIARGWLGQKKSQGFYKRLRKPEGSEILVLDPETMSYRTPKETPFASVRQALSFKDPADRIRAICNSNDLASRFAWKHLSAVLCYSANHLEEIAHDLVSVDRVMRWGFNWERGPFEIWDALGVGEVVARLEKEGSPVPILAQKLLNSGASTFYTENDGEPSFFDLRKGSPQAIKKPKSHLDLSTLHCTGKGIVSNPGASVIDLGDGVACLEFHNKANTLGLEQLETFQNFCRILAQDFNAGVIGNQGSHFSAGADLKLLLSCIETRQWTAMEEYLKSLQEMTTSLRSFPKPIVVASHGYALGAGCEVVLSSDNVVTAAELYMGLPEVRAGLVPSAGGCKELLVRAAALTSAEPEKLLEAVARAWENILFGRISASAHEACVLGLLHTEKTKIILNKDLLIGSAKLLARELFSKPQESSIPWQLPALGKSGIDHLETRLQSLLLEKKISPYDAGIGRKLAIILCGGENSSTGTVSVQTILDLEREALLSLSGQAESVERIKKTLHMK